MYNLSICKKKGLEVNEIFDKIKFFKKGDDVVIQVVHMCGTATWCLICHMT